MCYSFLNCCKIPIKITCGFLLLLGSWQTPTAYMLLLILVFLKPMKLSGSITIDCQQQPNNSEQWHLIPVADVGVRIIPKLNWILTFNQKQIPASIHTNPLFVQWISVSNDDLYGHHCYSIWHAFLTLIPSWMDKCHALIN